VSDVDARNETAELSDAECQAYLDVLAFDSLLLSSEQWTWEFARGLQSLTPLSWVRRTLARRAAR